MKKVLFLNLTAFSQTGGLEKFNRCFLKALAEIEVDTQMVSQAYSMYDTVADEKYYPQAKYKGFGLSRISFVMNSVMQGLRSDVVILGHINLAIVGYLIKMIAPQKKVMLICHGIEVWEPLQGMKQKMLNSANKILAVSEYTRQQIMKLHNIAADKVAVFHNTIDPYFPLPKTFDKNKALLQRYGLIENDFVLFTLCRLSSKEKYKGYDNVVKALPQLLKKYPNIRYVIAGKYDEQEKDRMDVMIEELGVQDKVVFTGYVDDKEIIQHYQLGDVYVMPSQGEGFGIVFIEAMACGQRVIAGNKDGSVDALANGELGKLVNPDDVNEIADAVASYYEGNAAWNTTSSAVLQEKVLNRFGFDVYKNRMKQLLPTLF